MNKEYYDDDEFDIRASDMIKKAKERDDIQINGGYCPIDCAGFYGCTKNVCGVAYLDEFDHQRDYLNHHPEIEENIIIEAKTKLLNMLLDDEAYELD